jgi:hypothetical protein
MSRPVVNYVVDWVAFLLFSSLVSTGMLLHFSLPPGSGGNMVFGLSRHEWGDVHFWISVGFLSAVAVHLCLHSAWIKALTLGHSGGSQRGWRGGVAVVVGVICLAVMLMFLFLPVSEGTIGRGGAGKNVGNQEEEHGVGGDLSEGRGRHRGRSGE